MQNATIVACGAYAPERVIPNSYFNEVLGEDVDTWLRENVHIYERRWCAPDESTADLAEKAARQTLERAGVEAEALDLIIISTDTPEYVSPSTASVVQHRLGATKAGTFDINTACAGFVTALDIGSKYIRADERYQNVLVIGAYAMSKYLNKEDKKTVTLFADGAGAVLLQATQTEGRGFLASELITKGEYHDWMGIYGGAARQPVDQAVLEHHDHQLKFVRKFPKELNPETWTQMAQNLSCRISVKPTEVNRFFITQININAIWETLDRLGVARDKGHTVMHQYGYTGSACIPMAFNDAWEKELIREGDLVYFIGSGGGLAFASTAFVL
ncbi:3-oxoacyl-ACP synthase III family protein [Flavilitoribacter nigricans]|uniref:3-ketoacyl-ACP synthase n=1 Tax=Flavilitoribacter nigricans (strain ATCC 23147 / DSM 23189 / NBRC 102662 / NCIMB 1420 / SS-2) TaxID=1122177 RepID=A0A2D0NEC0_FLAN2|nr:ketoacyl-ACP synthase III [Flavilitoribacter nigricans]PHN06529.1 3-ketoacyl-ACP synthase [Flavilitoribacter nigricans DSM 23189 = NBRC 102662]